MKTLGHRSKNQQELISKRTFVPRQGRISLGATSTGAAGGSQLLMSSGVSGGSQ